MTTLADSRARALARRAPIADALAERRAASAAARAERRRVRLLLVACVLAGLGLIVLGLGGGR